MLNDNMMKALTFTPGVNGRWGLPGLMWGDPGIGKTVQVKEFCLRHGLDCIVLTLSLREPSDLLGIPIPIADPNDPSKMITVYASPLVAQEAVNAVNEGRGVVVFLDELTTAAPALQAAGLRVVNEGVIGDETLPEEVRFLAAANPTDIAAGGHDLAVPLANRFGHFETGSASTMEWCKWLMEDGGEKVHKAVTTSTDLEKQVMKRWDAVYAKTRANIATFMQRTGGSHLHKMPKGNDPQASMSWPSPRTWELATRAMAGAEIHGLDPGEAQVLMSGFVGEGATIEYINWLHAGDLPDPEALLDGKEKFTHDQRRPDRTLATLNACATILISMKGNTKAIKEKKAARQDNFWLVAEEAAGGGEDMILSAVRLLAKSAGGFKVTKQSTEILKRISPMLREIGQLHTA
jgi:hypothetical protein